MIRKLLFIIFVCTLLRVDAQICLSDIKTDKVFTKITGKSKLGIYKSQKIAGTISGMGAFKSRNGDLYFGDFRDKVLSGNGVFMAKDSITNCPGAVVYVGKLKNGLKMGKGRCYNSNGELTYAGKFRDDKPVDTYPMTDFSGMEFPYFTSFSGNNYDFIGEFVGDLPNGAGILIFDTGDIYLTNLKEGKPDGIGVVVRADGEWYSDKVENGESTPLSSSQEYAELRKRAKANFRAGLSMALGYFAESAQTGASVAHQIRSVSNGGTNIAELENSGEDLRSSTKSGSNIPNKYNLSEQRLYNSDKSLYHKYDGMLAKVFAGNSSASESEIKEWQSRMRKLREKWEAKGRDFPHFPNEDK